MADRLQKLIAQAGIASRRASEQFILDGRVKVNGKIVKELGSKADLSKDTIEVEGYGTIAKQPLVYIAMHKPVHVVTTMSDPLKRQTVHDLLNLSRAQGKRQFEGELPRIFPVGRLDYETEGLLLMTNDGDLSDRMLKPKYHVPKTYQVKVKGRPIEKAIERLRKGVRLLDKNGRPSRRPTRPAEVTVTKRSPANTWLEMTIFEGRNRQIRRMCDAIGHMSIRIVRTEFGPISLDPLPPGAWRFLTKPEVNQLKTWTASA